MTKNIARHSTYFRRFGRMYCLFLLLGPLYDSALSGAVSAGQAVDYLLGPRDIVTIRVSDVEEFTAQNLGPTPIDSGGDVHLPLVGVIHASGLTSKQLEKEVARRMSTVVNEPDVSVVLTEAKSHPVSVIGALKNPGVYQVTGKQSLFEVLSLAGGLATEAGNTVKITRRIEMGPLPLSTAKLDPSGEFNVGELNLRSVMAGKDPSENIQILAEDVISVPRADLVYVVGAVTRPGGFVLSEKEHLSVLQAISLAEGLTRVAAGRKARILREDAKASGNRTETVIDIDRILSGQAKDVSLLANDILFIPNSAAKSASVRALEAGIQLATGVVIYGRF